jgi:hypothetical protein
VIAPVAEVESGAEPSTAPPAGGWRLSVPTVLAVVWVFLAAFLYLLPSLLRGSSLGSVDIISTWALTAVPGAHSHNGLSGDQVEDMIPWAVLSWKQVHQGHFPLWNPYSGFGMPLFGNFQSASLSLPALVSYLGPVKLVFTVQVYVKMVIAGTGVLWMGRRLGMGNLASAFGATAFMLSGSFTGWLGWPMSGTMAWLGWSVGAAILIVRGERRRLHTAGLAAVIAFAVYAGHPETLAMVMGATAIVAVFALIGPLWRRPRDAGWAVLALVAAGAGGAGLSAPLLLPGLQIIGRSNRRGVIGYAEVPRASLHLLFATYHGLPLSGSVYFGPHNYYESADYVGFAVAVLAGVALLTRLREPTVQGLAAVAAICAFLVYSRGLARYLDRIPLVKSVQWTRSVIALDFCLAVLAAFGLQALLDRGIEPFVRRTFAAFSAAAATALGVLWFHHVGTRMPAQKRAIQAHSFVWPAVEVAVLLIAAVALELRPLARSSGRHAPRSVARAGALWSVAAAGLVFAANAAFFLTATPTLLSSSDTFFPVTPTVATLVRDTGGSGARIGFAKCAITTIPPEGILVEANGVYGVSEAAAYDGSVPRSYFTAYFAYIHQPVPPHTGIGQWCPSIPDAQTARHFGVSYILTTCAEPAPPGAVAVADIAGEGLYRVPAGGVITVQPDGTGPDRPNAGVPVVDESDPSTLRTKIDVLAPSTVYIHVTNFPGWKATLDGHPLALRTWGGTMLAASIPAGHHTLVVRYQPEAFEIGIWLAAASALALGGILAWRPIRRRVRSGS